MTSRTSIDPGEDNIPASKRLPIELVRLILEATGDWELCTTLGIITTRLEITSPWVEFATPLDHAILHSSSSLLPLQDAFTTTTTTPYWTQWGTRVLVRFSLLPSLRYLLSIDPHQLRLQTRQLLPVVASAWGRTEVLEWAFNDTQGPRLGEIITRETIEEAVDDASRHGQVAVLDFWLASSLPMYYSEAALSSATIKSQLGSLEWWKEHAILPSTSTETSNALSSSASKAQTQTTAELAGQQQPQQATEKGKGKLPLKIGNVLDFASMEGTTVTLDWWSTSGLPVRYSKAALHSLSRTSNIPLLNWWLHSPHKLLYDKEVILVSTRYGATASLSWWLESGLEMEYRFFDIEEALEDSVSAKAKERAQRWWEVLGYDTGMSTNEWTRLRNFKHQRREKLLEIKLNGLLGGGASTPKIVQL